MPSIDLIKHPSNDDNTKRKGRGKGSGAGCKSGRGQTGQKSRSGGSIHPRFEGEQNPLVRKFPKFSGFKRHSKIHYYPVNTEQFSELPDGTTVDLAFLAEQKMLPSKKRGLRVKLLGDGKLTKKINFKLHAFSHKAREMVEKAGGSCEVI